MKQVVCVRTDLQMNRGKIAAQVAHASMLFMIDNIGGHDTEWSKVQWEWMKGPTHIDGWKHGGMAKIVVCVKNENQLMNIWTKAKAAGLEAHLVTDKTLECYTCCAIGPDEDEKIDSVTKKLQLLKDVNEHDKLASLVTQFFGFLDAVEESDSGREFHPVSLGCCRTMMIEPMEKCLREIRETLGIGDRLKLNEDYKITDDDTSIFLKGKTSEP